MANMAEEQTPAQNNTQAGNVEQAQQAPASTENAQAQGQEASANQAGQAAQEVTEVAYDVKLPDGSLLAAEKVEEVVAYAKDNKLTNEQAQALINRESDAVKSWRDSQESAFEETKAKWVETVMSDKEIGGADFNKNVEFAHRALERFASPELKDALSKTGFGNHPELVRVFARIGKAMANDSLVKGGADRPGQKKSMEEIFYGSNN